MGGNLACVVYFARAAHAFNAGIKCRHSIGINKYLSVHVWLITLDLYMNESNWVQFSFLFFIAKATVPAIIEWSINEILARTII